MNEDSRIPPFSAKAMDVIARSRPFKENEDFLPYRPHVIHSLENRPFEEIYTSNPGGVYRTIAEALRAIGNMVPMISCEYPSTNREAGNGYRKYLIMSYMDIYRTVYRAPKHERSYYEVIIGEHKFCDEPYGGRPCLLYVDLDLDLAQHPDRNIDDALAVWTYYLRMNFELHRAAGHEGFDFDPNDVVVSTLISRKPGKGSMHIVYHLPGRVYFRNTYHVGNFVDNTLSLCMAALGLEKNPLFIDVPTKDKNGMTVIKKQPIVDVTIYNSNRNFRMPFCGKRQPTANHPCFPLVPVLPREKIPLVNAPLFHNDQEDVVKPEVFMSYLVSYVPRDHATGMPLDCAVISYADQRFAAGAEQYLDQLTYLRKIGTGNANAHALAYQSIPQPPTQQKIGFKRSSAEIADEAGEAGEARGEDMSDDEDEPRTNPWSLAYMVRDVINQYDYRREWPGESRVEASLGCSVVRVFTNGLVVMSSRSLFCKYVGKKHDNNKIMVLAVMKYPRPIVLLSCHSPDCASMRSERKLKLAIPDETWDAAGYKEAMRSLIFNREFSLAKMLVPRPAPALTTLHSMINGAEQVMGAEDRKNTQ